MPEPITAAWFAEKIGDRSAIGLSLETRALIRAGALPVGTRLPPVRDLALELGVSPATVSAAWTDLRRLGILSGRGRSGMWVTGERTMTAPTRFASIGNFGAGALDLSLAVPDRALLPPLAAALAHGAGAAGLNSYVREPILPELAEALAPTWPSAPEAMLATNGGYSAVYTVLQALSLTGARVAVEDPTAIRHLDILENIGAIILPVACDDEGPLPGALAAALAQRPVLFLYQPRLNSVTGRTLSPARMAALGELLADTDTLVLEDDGLGDLAAVPPQSLGARFPDRVIHVLSFAKTLGPDLRLAVLSGPADIVAQVKAYRSFSSGWTSRILQGAAAWLLRDPATRDIVVTARETYAARNAALEAAGRAAGLDHGFGTGLSAWVPVASESFAMVTLAARNIAVGPGQRHSLRQVSAIRMGSGLVAGDYERIAEALALAARDG
ncbi:PLP-dependent aminotransferase family protein [Frigidibacter sp. MR17.24]|uniref:PLP-dependent aminotransferase family protein n=1 Tax=Frigidibacter sp. MR17.24 TaxID=3127345 RepID=UPI0030131B37